MDVVPSRGRVRFGPFEMDGSAGELFKDGLKIRLQEQPLQVLQILLERPGEVISREELRNRAWPSDTFVDFEHGINNAIKRLRDALGDTADTPRFIETLPRRGYRFIAALEISRLEVAPTPLDSLAVFPFEHGGADPDTESLAIGIPGSVIHRISQIPKLRVISWRSTASNQNWQTDPLAIGRKLNAKAVLTGRIWQRAGKLRLHVDLLDTANGEEIWGEQYDRELRKIFELADEIAHEVSRNLRLKMSGEDVSRLSRRYTENIEAYQMYVRARRWCETRSTEGFKRGIEYLNRAIEMDPNYALAHAELAQCISVPCYYGSVDPRVAYPKARAAALRALEIDPGLPEAHEVLATVLKNFDWNWDAAEKEYKHAIQLNPNYATAHYHYSYLLAELGRFEEAIPEATEALSRDPMSSLLNAGLAFVLLNARKFDQCIQQSLTALEVDPNMALSYWSLAVAYEQQGRFLESLEVLERGLGRGAGIAISKAFISRVHAAMGERERAWGFIRDLQNLTDAGYVPSIAFVLAYEALGEIDLAIAALTKALQNRDTNLIQIKCWPQFDRLRDDLRFQKIERQIGLRP